MMRPLARLRLPLAHRLSALSARAAPVLTAHAVERPNGACAYATEVRKSGRTAGALERLLLRSGVTQDADLARILARAGSTTLYGFAALTALGTLGVDITPLIAGVSVTGFAAGFALKEIATNFLSGLMLVFSKPFVRGQSVRVLGGPGGPYEGRVESIDPRYVLLRTRDGAITMVPSAVVYSSALLVLPDPKP